MTRFSNSHTCPLAIGGNRLYLVSDDLLYCIGDTKARDDGRKEQP